MSQAIERIENLIRVVSKVPDSHFDLWIWYNQNSCRGCALGHAMQDEYFIAHKFCKPYISLQGYDDIADYFEISEPRTRKLFVRHLDYESRQDVLIALRVLLLEKMAQELPAQLESMKARFGAELKDLEPAE